MRAEQCYLARTPHRRAVSGPRRLAEPGSAGRERDAGQGSERGAERNRTAVGVISVCRLAAVSGPLPRFLELVAVEEPEDTTYEKQHGFIKRPGHGGQAECASPSDRPRDPTVTNHEVDGSDRSAEPC
jgi:hypothetical protein